jgi:hypothetical protein
MQVKLLIVGSKVHLASVPTHYLQEISLDVMTLTIIPSSQSVSIQMITLLNRDILTNEVSVDSLQFGTKRCEALALLQVPCMTRRLISIACMSETAERECYVVWPSLFSRSKPRGKSVVETNNKVVRTTWCVCGGHHRTARYVIRVGLGLCFETPRSKNIKVHSIGDRAWLLIWL